MNTVSVLVSPLAILFLVRVTPVRRYRKVEPKVGS